MPIDHIELDQREAVHPFAESGVGRALSRPDQPLVEGLPHVIVLQLAGKTDRGPGQRVLFSHPVPEQASAALQRSS
jgi:hypothetical protein